VFSLLACLIENHERVVSKDELIEMVWDGRIVSDGTLNTRINSVRRAVGDDGKAQAVIKTFPRRGFRFVAELEGEGGAEMPPTEIPAMSDKPSIAVLPFDNLSGDPEQEYFSDGMAQDIITALCRLRWLKVIARDTTFTYKQKSVDVAEVAGALNVRYVVEGSVRMAGNRVRISVQLIDASDGKHVWAERYDRELEDIFEVQDDITLKVAGSVQSALGKAELERAVTAKPENIDAWTAYQQGLHHFNSRTEEGFDAAQKMMARATELDPNFTLAHAGEAMILSRTLVFGYKGHDRERALAAARRAILLDSEEAAAHFALGQCYFFGDNNLSGSLVEYETAVRLNPSYSQAYHLLGLTYMRLGRKLEAIDTLKSAIDLSPMDQMIGVYFAGLSVANLALQDYDQAVEWGQKAIAYPQPRWAHAYLLSAYGHLERDKDARVVLELIAEVRPEFTTDFVRDNLRAVGGADLEHLLDGLKKAGMAEK
jgi:adenylate cyclase